MQPSMGLRKTVLTHGKSLLDSPAIRAYAVSNETSAYYREAMKHYKKLEDFEFSVAVAAEQSAGKTSIRNTLLAFPLLPVCSRSATRSVTM